MSYIGKNRQIALYDAYTREQTDGNYMDIDGFQNIVVFDTSGVSEWTVPDILNSGERKVYVIVIGGGAGGGRHDSYSGGGGGGGGIAEGIVDLSGVTSVSITVGAGGAGRTGSTGPGDAGGSSSFGAYMSATGGIITTGGSGSGGLGSGGDINTSYGPGGHSSLSVYGSSYVSGDGGGPGGYARSSTAASTGNDAIAPGGGGGGSVLASNAGSGANGKVIVRW